MPIQQQNFMIENIDQAGELKEAPTNNQSYFIMSKFSLQGVLNTVF